MEHKKPMDIHQQVLSHRSVIECAKTHSFSICSSVHGYRYRKQCPQLYTDHHPTAHHRLFIFHQQTQLTKKHLALKFHLPQIITELSSGVKQNPTIPSIFHLELLIPGNRNKKGRVNRPRWTRQRRPQEGRELSFHHNLHPHSHFLHLKPLHHPGFGF